MYEIAVTGSEIKFWYCTITGMLRSKEQGSYVRTGGQFCFSLSIPSTGSMPIRAEKGSSVVAVETCYRARAKAALPTLLWLEIIARLGWNGKGRTAKRPLGSQSMTAAVDLISLVESGPATVYSSWSWKGKGISLTMGQDNRSIGHLKFWECNTNSTKL